MKTLQIMLAWGEKESRGEDVVFKPELIQRGEVTYTPTDAGVESHMAAYSEMVDHVFMDTINRLFDDLEGRK